MITPLAAPLKRSISVDGHDYTVVMSPEGIRITPKGKRKGSEFTWQQLLGGGSALVDALNASLGVVRPNTERISS
ncbi:hypothetical protein DSM104443_02112 [Usitatibacter rugosus]|uniref:Uncharacterized protein n=1 Tax=Usitatibacter rugosus TaxID=2732067 RepID=A0A6M4GUN7_9PROT|nr:hypothetical protein [Usitatibacter rugosus]QJR11041.1 hypothetical protein DSM104443_02112 [Usitatibacter rugosus]